MIDPTKASGNSASGLAYSPHPGLVRQAREQQHIEYGSNTLPVPQYSFPIPDDWLGLRVQLDTTYAVQPERERIVHILILSWALSRLPTPGVETVCGHRIGLEQSILREYAAMAEVALIYSDIYRSKHLFQVFVRGAKYDDALMDRLLGRELCLKKQYLTLHFGIDYLPFVPGQGRPELVREQAKLIFGG